MDITFECRIPWEALRYRRAERAALLIGNRHADDITVRFVVPAANEHHDSSEHFRISAEQINSLVGQGDHNIVGVLHSHPRDLPHPSLRDLTGIPRGLVGGVLIGRRITWYERDRLIYPIVRHRTANDPATIEATGSLDAL